MSEMWPYLLQEAEIVSERKLGFFVQIKEDDPADGGINRRNTLSISRINPPQAG